MKKSAATIALAALISSIVSASASPVLSLQPWDSNQTDLFSASGTVGTVAAWAGNNLLLQYSADANSSARSLSSSFELNNPLPSPANAVGIAFDVHSNQFPILWAVNLDLGRYLDGMMTSFIVCNNCGPNPTPYTEVVSFVDGMLLRPDEQLAWSSFAPVDSNYINESWSVEMFFPDQWLFDRSSLAQRFIFTGTQLAHNAPGTVEFDNVSWILSDPFPGGQPIVTAVAEPSSLAIFAAGLLLICGIALAGSSSQLYRQRI